MIVSQFVMSLMKTVNTIPALEEIRVLMVSKGVLVKTATEDHVVMLGQMANQVKLARLVNQAGQDMENSAHADQRAHRDKKV